MGEIRDTVLTPAGRSPARVFMDMIKFEHTVFALPFAYLGYFLGSEGRVVWSGLLWVTAAMVGARTAGMCLNRLIDREIDARNPRTKNWALVTGAVRPGTAWAAAAAGLAVLFVSAASLNRFCLLLSPVAFILLFFYPYLKRITVYSHLGIGLVLACAPLGGWAAARGGLGGEAFLLAAAVLFWVAGFDIYYSLQDEIFDRGAGLKSIPARWGGAAAVRIAQAFHFLTLIFLSVLGIMMSLNWIYWTGLIAAAGILTAEYVLMRKLDLKNVGPAFFTLNGVLSSGFFLVTVGSVVTSR